MSASRFEAGIRVKQKLDRILVGLRPPGSLEAAEQEAVGIRRAFDTLQRAHEAHLEGWGIAMAAIPRCTGRHSTVCPACAAWAAWEALLREQPAPVDPSRTDAELEMRAQAVKEWRELVSGLALLWMGPKGAEDDSTRRAARAIDAGDMAAMETISALLLCQLPLRGIERPAFADDQWGRLSRSYHTLWCPQCKGAPASPDVEL